MIRINEEIAIAPDEVRETFIRASGPGGQNVNKVSSAVQLRFDARRSPSLDAEVKRRLEELAGSRMTRDGEIVITASRHRTQAANRRDAMVRLINLIAQAARAPAARVATRPTSAGRARRRDDKTRRSRLKRQRGERFDADE